MQKILKRSTVFLFLSLFLFMASPVFGIEDEEVSGVTVVAAPLEATGDSEAEALLAPYFIDSRIKLIQEKATLEIAAKVDEINQLSDQNLEKGLQKEIEEIKLAALIARYKITLEKAEEKEDYDLVDELIQEIDRLEYPVEPISSNPSEQETYMDSINKKGE